MNIELSAAEIETLEASLDAWEKSPAQEGIFSSMIGAMLHKDEAKAKAEMESSRIKMETEILRRKRISVMIRAKLYSANTALQVQNAFIQT